MSYTLISYCCGTYPDVGGVARFDSQLNKVFPNKFYFKSPKQLFKLESFLKKCKNPIVITDNGFSCDIPNNYPVIIMNHGPLMTCETRCPEWNGRWKRLCCEKIKKMITYRDPKKTWIIHVSHFGYDEFEKYYGDSLKEFHSIVMPLTTEFDNKLYKNINTFSKQNPIIIGNWCKIMKGQKIIPLLKQKMSNYIFKELNVYPNDKETLDEFNKRKQMEYINADICLQLSVCEGFSYSAFDAIACGLVVVTTDTGIFYKEIPENCFVKLDWKRVNDLEYLEERINYAWKNKEQLSINAREWFLKNGDYDLWCDKFKTMVEMFYNKIYG